MQYAKYSLRNHYPYDTSYAGHMEQCTGYTMVVLGAAVPAGFVCCSRCCWVTNHLGLCDYHGFLLSILC